MTGCVHTAALAVIEAGEIDAKLAATARLLDGWATGGLAADAHAEPPRVIERPGFPAALRLVPPAELPRRRPGSVEGRAAMLHAVAHIEFNAIHLAADAVYRFRGLPPEFYADWIAVAGDEARHFGLLRERLAEYGLVYGDLPAHGGLWDAAVRTADDLLARLALVPRGLEARGLDVTPPMIERFEQAGDTASAAALRVIAADEIGHVAAGSRWFRAICAQRKLEPVPTFRDLMQTLFAGGLRGPFDLARRRAAGFTDEEIEWLEQLA